MAEIKKHRKPWIPDRSKPKTNESWAYDKRYSSPRWKGYRKTFLKENRLCVLCKEADKITVATVVDHIIPVSKGGDFWDPDNHQALCKGCNSRKAHKKTLIERYEA